MDTAARPMETDLMTRGRQCESELVLRNLQLEPHVTLGRDVLFAGPNGRQLPEAISKFSDFQHLSLGGKLETT